MTTTSGKKWPTCAMVIGLLALCATTGCGATAGQAAANSGGGDKDVLALNDGNTDTSATPDVKAVDSVAAAETLADTQPTADASAGEVDVAKDTANIPDMMADSSGIPPDIENPPPDAVKA